MVPAISLVNRIPLFHFSPYLNRCYLRDEQEMAYRRIISITAYELHDVITKACFKRTGNLPSFSEKAPKSDWIQLFGIPVYFINNHLFPYCPDPGV